MGTDGVLDEIRNRLDIVEFISEHVPLKRAGRNYKGLCPFHSEQTPSFMVSQEKQIFHCFGCGAGGDIFGFLMRHENLGFREAMEVLAARAGVEIRPRSPAEQGQRERLRAANEEARAFFMENLQKSRGALDYLMKRGINEPSIRAFSLGYAPQGWHHLLDRLRARGFGAETAIKAGLAAQGSKGAYDVFRARIIFPIFDTRGETVAFGGRVMDDAMPKYLNSPDTPLFKKSETLYALGQARDGIRKTGWAAVVEGYLDAIMCHQLGIANAVAPLGTALTAGHLKRLSALAEDFLLVFDGDDAGQAAAQRSLGLILQQGLRARVLMLPRGDDPDSVLRNKGAEHMRALMDRALTPVEFVLEKKGTGGVRDAIALIALVGDPLLRDEMVLELSEMSRTREMTIREELARHRKAGSSGGRARPASLPYNEEVLLLSAALAVPEKTGEILGRIRLDDLREKPVRAIFGRLQGDKKTPLSPMEAAETEDERALVSRLSINPGFDPSDLERNIDDCVRRINKKRLDERIKNAETAGDLRLLSRLYSERQKLVEGN
jgi:DNA primase